MGLSFSSAASWDATSRNILITGASSGIGAELARCLAREGGNLALVARNQTKLEEVAKECRKLGSEKVHIYSCDLTKNAEIEASMAKALDDFKGFDVVVMNAGRSQGCFFEEIQDVDQIDYMMKLNVGGVIIPLQKLLPGIHKSRQSRIVVVSSVAGKIPVLYRTIYSASKAALNGFCNSLRLELGETYGGDAPKVCIMSFPEIKGTLLNEGRMDFGSMEPAVQFKDDGAGDLHMACQGCLKAIRRGSRSWGEPFKVKLLLPLYPFIPRVIETMILKHLRRTHYRPATQANLRDADKLE
jgi:NADP-dependent 3-hydroxy acid dehydrogenase YdfG